MSSPAEASAILSSRIYPKGTFVRDAFYGPMALGDELSHDCYRWFERTQLPNGQIRTAVGFTPKDQAVLAPMDDDSTLLFIIWSAGSAAGASRSIRNSSSVPLHVRSHVDERGAFVSPPGAFRFWADTVSPEAPERITHNQGLYALALRSMHALGWGDVTFAHVAAAKKRYAACYDAVAGSLTLGRDTWWASKLDISTVFPEFLFRWAFGDGALPNSIITATVARHVGRASVYKDGKIAGIKVICDDGAFARRRFHVRADSPATIRAAAANVLRPGVSLRMRRRVSTDRSSDARRAELSDHESKKFIVLQPGAIGAESATE
jgi:hypothetical protein